MVKHGNKVTVTWADVVRKRPVSQRPYDSHTTCQEPRAFRDSHLETNPGKWSAINFDVLSIVNCARAGVKY